MKCGGKWSSMCSWNTDELLLLFIKVWQIHSDCVEQVQPGRALSMLCVCLWAVAGERRLQSKHCRQRRWHSTAWSPATSHTVTAATAARYAGCRQGSSLSVYIRFIMAGIGRRAYMYVIAGHWCVVTADVLQHTISKVPGLIAVNLCHMFGNGPHF